MGGNLRTVSNFTFTVAFTVMPPANAPAIGIARRDPFGSNRQNQESVNCMGVYSAITVPSFVGLRCTESIKSSKAPRLIMYSLTAVLTRR